MSTSYAKLFSANYEQFRLLLSQFFSLSIITSDFPRLIFNSSRWLCPRSNNSKQAIKFIKKIIFPNPEFQPQKYSDPIRDKELQHCINMQKILPCDFPKWPWIFEDVAAVSCLGLAILMLFLQVVEEFEHILHDLNLGQLATLFRLLFFGLLLLKGMLSQDFHRPVLDCK
jgi:hypothetical protein